MGSPFAALQGGAGDGTHPLLGRLPGDIRIERPGLRIDLPITTCVVNSLALSAGLWLLSRLR